MFAVVVAVISSAPGASFRVTSRNGGGGTLARRKRPLLKFATRARPTVSSTRVQVFVARRRVYDVVVRLAFRSRLLNRCEWFLRARYPGNRQKIIVRTIRTRSRPWKKLGQLP